MDNILNTLGNSLPYGLRMVHDKELRDKCLRLSLKYRVSFKTLYAIAAKSDKHPSRIAIELARLQQVNRQKNWDF